MLAEDAFDLGHDAGGKVWFNFFELVSDVGPGKKRNTSLQY